MNFQNKTREELLTMLQEMQLKYDSLKALYQKDVTEHKKNEEALKESEQHYHQIVDLSQDMIVIHQQGKVVFINDAGVKLVGATSPDQLIGRSVLDFVPPNRRKIAQERMQSGLADGEHKSPVYEQKLRRLDGIVIDIEVHGMAIRYQGEEAIHFVARDITKHKQAEEALCESEARYRTLFLNAAEGILVADINTKKFIYANPAQCRMLGYTKEELEQLSLKDIHPKKDLEWITNEFIAQARGEKTFATDIPCIRKDRTTLYADICTSPMVIDGKECNVGFFSDITDRKRAEEALQESERRYREIFENTSESINIYNVTEDHRFQLIDSNPATERFTGINRNLLIGRFFDELLPNENMRVLLEHYRECLEKGTAISYEHQFCLDGRCWIVYYTHIPVRDATGRIYRLVSIGMDITERKATERQLTELKEFNESIIRNSPTGIVTTALDGKVTGANPAALKILGSPSEEKTRQFNVLTMENMVRQGISANFERCLRDGEEIDIELKYRTIWGKDTVISLGIVPLRSADNTRIGAVAMLDDITERKRAEEKILQLNAELEQRVFERTAQIEAANKELEAFSYSVSHDLRAPLRGIDGFSQILLEEYQDKVDEQGKNYLQRVRSAAQQMAQLIDDMLNLSRVSRSEMNTQQVNLSEMAKDISDNLIGNQPERKVEFVIQEGIKVGGDRHLLRIVLENLFGNAWKFTSKHPTARIEFGMQLQKEIPVYFVRDDGAGFEMKYAQKLFGAFQRLHTTIEFPGTGVGLATVQRIIHRHGGKVWAEGEIEKGTTFYFTISNTIIS